MFSPRTFYRMGEEDGMLVFYLCGNHVGGVFEGCAGVLVWIYYILLLLLYYIIILLLYIRLSSSPDHSSSLLHHLLPIYLHHSFLSHLIPSQSFILYLSILIYT
jgi:hypothetical protein